MVLGPVLFKSFIDDLEDGTDYTLTKFADNPARWDYRQVRGQELIQNELDSLRKKWSNITWVCHI